MRKIDATLEPGASSRSFFSASSARPLFRFNITTWAPHQGSPGLTFTWQWWQWHTTGFQRAYFGPQLFTAAGFSGFSLFFETKGKVSLPVSLDYDPNTLTTKIHEVLSGLITQTHKAGHHGHRPFLAIVCAATKPVPAVSTRCSFGESSQTRERKL